jgi:hypothetical protein
MSDTPETDRLTEEFKRNTLGDDIKLDILFSYTRKLERECTKVELERNNLLDIIHRASVAFCEEGRDGEVCARMFKILTEAKE